MCRGVIKCAAAAAAPPLGSYQLAKGREGDATGCFNSFPHCSGTSLIESLLLVPEDCPVARLPVPQKLKRFAPSGCPRSDTLDGSPQEPKRRKLVAVAGPLKAGPEEPVSTIVSQRAEAAAKPIILEDTCKDTSSADSDLDLIDSTADLLSSVSNADAITFPLTPEPEWQKILDDLETELNDFTPPSTSPHSPQEETDEEDAEMPLLTQLLKSRGPVREEYAKIESDPGKPPPSQYPLTPSQYPLTPPQEDFDSGYTSSVFTPRRGGSPIGLSSQFNTPLSPEDFGPSAFPLDPQDPIPAPLSYPTNYSTSVMPPNDTFEGLAYPPVHSSGQEWMFQFVAEPWERPVFSSPKMYPSCQPSLAVEDTAEFLPNVDKDDIGGYLLL